MVSSNHLKCPDVSIFQGSRAALGQFTLRSGSCWASCLNRYPDINSSEERIPSDYCWQINVRTLIFETIKWFLPFSTSCEGQQCELPEGGPGYWTGQTYHLGSVKWSLGNTCAGLWPPGPPGSSSCTFLVYRSPYAEAWFFSFSMVGSAGTRPWTDIIRMLAPSLNSTLLPLLTGLKLSNIRRPWKCDQKPGLCPKKLCLQTRIQQKHSCMIIVLKSKEWAKRSQGQVHKTTPEALRLQWTESWAIIHKRWQP